MASEFIYFVVHPYSTRQTLTVVDLQDCVSYERDEWRTVSNQDFDNHLEAIAHAKALAAKYGMRYEPFESRYNSDLNECLNLNLD